MGMTKQVLVGVLVSVLLSGLAGPGRAEPVRAAPLASGTPAHAAVFDKTRFVLHMGFAYFAFHHFVYARFHHQVVQADGSVTYENEFATGSPHRTANLVKAALAILFTVHELNMAYKIANGSSSATLQALVRPLNALIGLGDKEYARLRGCQSSAATSGASASATVLPTPEGTAVTGSGCQYTNKDIVGMNTAIDAFTKTAATHGVSISDKSVPVPGA